MTTETKQAAPTIAVTVSTFDLGGGPLYRTVREAQAIGEWAPITRRDYNPRGSTPLRDATAQFIGHLDRLQAPGTVTIGCLADESGSMSGNEESVVAGINEFVAGMTDVEVDPDTDGKVLAVILTDGYENASREVSVKALQEMIGEREKAGWTFIYLGANQDAWAVGFESGMSGQSASHFNYSSTPRGTSSAMKVASETANAYLADSKTYTEGKVNKAEMHSGIGTTTGTIDEEGNVAEVDLDAAPTSGSSYDIKSALDKAKES